MKNSLLAILLPSVMLLISCNAEDLRDLPFYGNWCGPLHSGGPDTPGIDSLDDQCKIHDLCYDAIPVQDEDYYDCAAGAKVDCDAAMVNDLKALDDDPDLWSTPPAPENRKKAIQYRTDALNLFGACVDLLT